MLVVEDATTNEIRRFFILDAMLQLGAVQVGSQTMLFDPQRAVEYYGMVEDRLHDYSTKYPEAFGYIPRRAYEYLKKPPMMSKLYQDLHASLDTEWFVDAFMVRPLLSVANTSLPAAQQTENIKLIEEWAANPPFSSRLYQTQEMRQGHRTNAGWACNLAASEIGTYLRGSNRTDLVWYFRSNLPVFIEMNASNELDALLEWLVFLKEAGQETPTLVFSVRDHREWGHLITRLLDIPGSRILTAGATISSLTLITRHLRKTAQDAPWSSRLIFASAYPETQVGDSVSEVLSFLLSKGAGADADDIQRILGGNILSLLPSRPPYLPFIMNISTVVAEGLLGKASLNEFARILRILAARKLQIIESFDYMISREGGVVHFDNVVMTVRDSRDPSANALALLKERDGSLRVSGWRQSFTDNISKRRADLFSTLVRAATRAEGPILDSPSHLNRFNYALLDCLKVRNPQELLSALHFGVRVVSQESGIIAMSEADMRAVEVSENESILALEAGTGQWWAGRAALDEDCPVRTIGVAEEDALLLGLRDSSIVDLVKHDGSTTDVEKAVFALDSEGGTSMNELIAYVYLHGDEIRTMLDGRVIGRGTRLWFGGKNSKSSMTLAYSVPSLESEELAKLPAEAIEFKPSQVFRPVNIVLCISTGASMGIRDMQLKTLLSTRRKLHPFVSNAPELSEFLAGLGRKSSRIEIAVLAALHSIQNLATNRSDGELGIVTYSEAPVKFSIQKGDAVRTSVRFSNELTSEEVLVSTMYNVLDTIGEVGGRSGVSGAFRSIAEFLEEFGSQMPTLALIFTSGIREEIDAASPFLQALSSKERYRIDLFQLGESARIDFQEQLDGVNIHLRNLSSFSSDEFEGHFAEAIESLLPTQRD